MKFEIKIVDTYINKEIIVVFIQYTVNSHDHLDKNDPHDHICVSLA